MKFNRNQAKTLANAKELELYDAARASQLTKHSIAELKNLVKRSRTLRDKLLDKKRNQIRGGQAKGRPKVLAAPDRSREKSEMFAEVHEIFVARLEKMQERVEKEAAKAAAKKQLTSATKPVSRPRSSKATTASKAAQNPEVDRIQKPQTAARRQSSKAKVNESRIARSGVTQKRAHLSSANKRNQARRDSK